MIKSGEKKERRGESGQTMVEAVICMLMICLVLFGLLQVFYLAVAGMVADYAAFCTARSASVGFSDYLLNRTSRVAAIGASGDMIEPTGYDYSPIEQLWLERGSSGLASQYIQGVRWLEYEYSDNMECRVNRGMDTVEAEFTASDYPVELPMSGAYWGDEGIDITAESRVMNYSRHYLE